MSTIPSQPHNTTHGHNQFLQPKQLPDIMITSHPARPTAAPPPQPANHTFHHCSTPPLSTLNLPQIRSTTSQSHPIPSAHSLQQITSHHFLVIIARVERKKPSHTSTNPVRELEERKGRASRSCRSCWPSPSSTNNHQLQPEPASCVRAVRKENLSNILSENLACCEVIPELHLN